MALLVAVATALWQVSEAQVVAKMTPAAIDEAIRFGFRKKVSLYKMKRLRTVQGERKLAGFLHVRYSTPFLRVAAAASEAKRAGRSFSAADVKPGMTAPDVRMTVSCDFLVDEFHTGIVYVVNPASLEVSRASGDVVKPTDIRSSIESVEHRQTRQGARLGCTTLVARFPLSVLAPGNHVRVRVVPFSAGREPFDRMESNFAFDLAKTR